MVTLFGNVAGLGNANAMGSRIDRMPFGGGGLMQAPSLSGGDNPMAAFFASPLFGGSQPGMGGLGGQFGSFFSMLFTMLFSRLGLFGGNTGNLPFQPAAQPAGDPGGAVENTAAQAPGGAENQPVVAENSSAGNQPASFASSSAQPGISVSSPLIQVQDSATTGVSIRQLPGGENGSRHHIYVKILDANGNPVDGQVELINANGDRHTLGNGGNMPMWKNDNYTIRYNGTEIRGVDSHSGKAEPGSEWGHQSYEIVFREKSGGENGNPTAESGNREGGTPENPAENQPPAQNA